MIFAQKIIPQNKMSFVDNKRIKNQIVDLLDLIENTNNHIQINKEMNADFTSIKQWKGVKKRYVDELSDLLKNNYQIETKISS